MRIIHAGSASGAAADFGLYYGVSGFVFMRGNNAGMENSIAYSNNNLHGNWHYFLATDDRTDARLYIDGLLVAGPTLSSGWPVSSGTERRIGSASGGSNFWSDLIDEVRIYNRALTDQEIKQLYLMGR